MADPRPPWANVLLVVLTVILALAFTASVLHLSEYGGRLAFPPQYDDVSYLLAGFDLFETSLNEPLVSLAWPLVHQHAPFHSLLAFAGYRLFGVNERSAYQVNGILLVAFMLSVLWMTRPLEPVSRLSIMLIVLATPFTANLVAEFRPDLFWGLLCGFAVFLLVHPRLFESDWKTRVGALVLAVAGLHAKPSASPATALLLASALAMGIALRAIYRPFRSGEIARRVLMPFAVGVLLSAPFFITNARTLYDYMYIAFVTWRDVNQFHGSLLDHATFYSVGLCYRTALFTTLWIGLAAFVFNAYRLGVRRLNEELAYHLALVTMVVLAYLIPTLSGVKSYYLGGIFYGTFLVATIGTLAAIFRPWGAHPSRPAHRARWLLAVLAGTVLLTTPTVPFVHHWDPRLAADRRAAYQQMVSAIVADASQRQFAAPGESAPAVSHPLRPVSVYTASPTVMTAASVSLLARWQGIPTVGIGGYYTRTIQALQREAGQSDYLILSELHDSLYPGSIHSPRLLELVKNDPDFMTLSTFQDVHGSRTYLFRNRRAERGRNTDGLRPYLPKRIAGRPRRAGPPCVDY